jgi:hypothetical protein
MIVEPICLYCEHYDRDSAVTGTRTCGVFPKGIPLMYLEGKADHFDPHPDDGGVQFEMAVDLDTPKLRARIADRKD